MLATSSSSSQSQHRKPRPGKTLVGYVPVWCLWWSFFLPSSQPIYLPRWKAHSVELWCLCVGNVKAFGSRMTTRSWEGAAGAGCRFPLEVRRSGIFVFGIKEMILMFEEPERSPQHSVWGTQTGKMSASILFQDTCCSKHCDSFWIIRLKVY